MIGEAMTEKLLSVIVPIYNAESYIERCVDSIVDQTYQNLEIILVNDGSADNTLNKLKKYNKDPRVKIIQKKNEGVSLARNTGLDNAHGEYITFVDCDDYLQTDIYKAVMHECSNNDIDLLSFSVNVDYVDDGYKVSRTYEDVSCDKEGIKNIIPSYLSSGLFHIVWNKVYKAEILQKNKIYFLKEATNFEDVEFNYQVFEKINSFKHINHIGYNYIRSKEETLLSKFVKNNDKIFIENNKALISFINKMGLTDSGEMQQYYIEANFMNLENFVINLYKRNNDLSFNKKIDQIKKVIFNDENINIIKKYDPNYLFGKIFKTLCLFRSSYLLGISYGIFTFGKQHFYTIFQLIRKK